MAVKVYIDGQEGTTGLKILERFEGRTDIEILKIDPEKRKDNDERKKLINASDFTILCLPDAASIEAVSFIENENTRIIDASTAHRTNPGWAYGFPELSAEHREKIRTSKRVAVPGCYASGFLSMAYPLVKNGILPADYPVTVHAVSGYSGAGKKGIAQYEDENRVKEFDTPRQYALTQSHKHLPEMQVISGLQYKPMFNPYVCDYFAGMVVSLPLHTRILSKKYTPADIKAMFDEHYSGSNFIKVAELNGSDILTNGFISANELE
ncbi:MAG: N-acetyl-gamma-glutamyl-phosphate reductase, partial [Ruminiclostridium sp.]|nr:N-acetyl-gamma-glutamyl-phosphate reductase [Ruminiclostridium sp.]